MNLYGYASGDPINFDDPFGLCPRITMDGRNMLIEADLEVHGSVDEAFVADAISKYWGGSKGGYNVTLRLNVPDAPRVVVDVFSGSATTNQLANGQSLGFMNGGTMQFYSGSANAMARSAGHEFGHVLGIPQGIIDQGALMDDAARGSAIRRSDMRTVKQVCATPPKDGSPDKTETEKSQ